MGGHHQPDESFFVMIPNKRGHMEGVFETIMPYPRTDQLHNDEISIDLTADKEPAVLGEDDCTSPVRFDALASVLSTRRTKRFITVVLPENLSEGQQIDVS